MEEYYDVVDEKNELIGQSRPRSEVHKNGDWHRVVHIWLVNSKGEILIQKRSASKELSPNLWDLSVGGHISAGEEPLTAAVREFKEELGVDIVPEDFEFLFLQPEDTTLPNAIERNFHYVYLLRKDYPLSKFLQDSAEVEEIKFISLDEFEQSLRNHRKGWMSHWEEYSKIIKLLRGK